MTKLLFLDTETTGVDASADRLCQVCYKNTDELHHCLFKPSVPISIKAMSITHITNEMVADKKDFRNSKMHREIVALLQDHVLVAHNAPFDVAFLKAEDIAVPHYICTLRVAQHLDHEDSIPEYNLQYLRYYLGLNIPEAIAHDAKGDVLVLEALFERLLAKMLETHKDRNKAIEEMVRVSQNPHRIHTLMFGKYRGKKLRDLAQTDPGYLDWLLGVKQTELRNNPTDERLQRDIFSLKYYLGQK